jgi:hypothetical protein
MTCANAAATLPDALRVPPPRDPLDAPELFERNRGAVRNTVIVLLLLPSCVALLFLQDGAPVTRVVFSGCAAGAVVALIGASMHAERRRAQRLFTEGIATNGRVVSMGAAGTTRYGTALFEFEVSYQDRAGKRYAGRATGAGNEWGVARRAGDPIQVLCWPCGTRARCGFTSASTAP